jgi:hypothetical protein
VWAALGKPEEAKRLRERMVRSRPQGTVLDPGFLVVIDSALGETDSALEHLRQSISTRSPILFHMPGHPFLDSLRGDPRFGERLAEGGLRPLLP